MRTLKKTLSLVLVVAMVLGLCVVGASAKNAVDDYKDADQIGDAYYEAVGVMTGIGVIKGMGDGILSPTGNYTRAQAAKIITYMLIGEKAAESLVCTTAPFEDVAANHWAAGYIAFCVEQGIINGMSATTFEPEGPLTGFQWAKMLLCAVGFGSQGEFTGNSWSLNTAKVAHNVGLFAGDLAGADHVALQRQQAMLYAFNVLTTVPQVTYAPGITGYIEGVVNYKPVTDLGQTLGWSIYKLKSVTGIVVDNEGMGASATYVNSVVATEGTVKVVGAGNDLDMMYHAARVWYVAGKTNTGVFTYDLAKVETTNCPTTLPASYQKIGSGLNGSVPYQLDVVDNSAIGAGKTNVVFYYKLGYRGPVSNADKTTVIDSAKYLNANILTDISNVAYLDPVIYIYTHSVTEVSEATAYAVHAYTPTATTGVVSKIASDGTITLRDGTVIGKSNLAAASFSLGATNIGHSYTFLLDTHGHYYNVAENLTLVYYTGAYERVSGTYVGEEVYNVQVADVQTGIATNVRVDGAWKNNVNGPVVDTVNMTTGYYWLGEPNLNGVYTLTRWNPNYATDAGYVHSSNATFRATTGVQTMPNVDSTGAPAVYYTASSVKFIIASGSGSTYSYATYNSVAELLAGFNATGATTGTVSLRDMALTTITTTVGNVDTTIVFAYNATATSRYVFVPYDIDASKWTSMGEIADGTVLYYYEKGAYLNGDLITIYTTAPDDIERGFYSVRVNALGYSVLRDAARWFYEAENVVKSGNNYAQDSTSGLRQFASDAKILDFRKGVLAVKLDAITALELMNYYNEPALQLAYTLNAAGEIDVCYVVEKNLGSVVVDKAADWHEARSWKIDEVACINNWVHEYEDEVSFVLKPDFTNGYKPAVGANMVVTLRLVAADGVLSNPSEVKVPGKVAADGDVEVSFSIADFDKGVYSGRYTYKVEVADVVFAPFTVSTTTSLAISGANDANVLTVNDLAPGEDLYVKFNKTSIPAGMTVDVTVNGKACDETVASTAGRVQVGFNRTDSSKSFALIASDTDLVINTSVTVVVEIGYGADSPAAMDWNFKNPDSNANADRKTYVLEPGEMITGMQLQSTGAISETNDDYILSVVLYSDKDTSLDFTCYSVEAIKAANGVFTIKDFLPTVNSLQLRDFTFIDESLVAENA